MELAFASVLHQAEHRQAVQAGQAGRCPGRRKEVKLVEKGEGRGALLCAQRENHLTEKQLLFT